MATPLGAFPFRRSTARATAATISCWTDENDLNTIQTMYNYSPIVDAIQEFKTQGHNDLAEYGGVAGGIVSVVTKSGTNQYHGSLWEFLRNDAMDARGYFESSLPPRDRTSTALRWAVLFRFRSCIIRQESHLFYAALEGYRFRSASTTGVLVPTDAERNGDFSALSVPIYDPGDDHVQSGQPGHTRARCSLGTSFPATGSIRSQRLTSH